MCNELAGRCVIVDLKSGNKALSVNVTVDDLHIGNVVGLAKYVREMLSEHKLKHIIVNLSASNYIDSTVIGWLFELRHWSEQNKGKAVIVTRVPYHVSVMEATNLIKMLHVVGTYEEAVETVEQCIME